MHPKQINGLRDGVQRTFFAGCLSSWHLGRWVYALIGVEATWHCRWFKCATAELNIRLPKGPGTFAVQKRNSLLYYKLSGISPKTSSVTQHIKRGCVGFCIWAACIQDTSYHKLIIFYLHKPKVLLYWMLCTSRNILCCDFHDLPNWYLFREDFLCLDHFVLFVPSFERSIKCQDAKCDGVDKVMG